MVGYNLTGSPSLTTKTITNTCMILSQKQYEKHTR